jgi:hypothetical protein
MDSFTFTQNFIYGNYSGSTHPHGFPANRVPLPISCPKCSFLRNLPSFAANTPF